MKVPAKADRRLPPAGAAPFPSLAALALDLRWSWNHAADEVWRHLDAVLWDLTHHPYDVLQTASLDGGSR